MIHNTISISIPVANAKEAIELTHKIDGYKRVKEDTPTILQIITNDSDEKQYNWVWYDGKDDFKYLPEQGILTLYVTGRDNRMGFVLELSETLLREIEVEMEDDGGGGMERNMSKFVIKNGKVVSQEYIPDTTDYSEAYEQAYPGEKENKEKRKEESIHIENIPF